MKIAIIGAGYTGLAAAYDLVKSGAEVVIYESAEQAGGLAGGFFEKNWKWPLEYHYHHVFETDKSLKRWLSELGLSDQLYYKSTRSYSLTQSALAQFDSPLTLLKFPGLFLFNKIRTGVVMAGLKLWPWGKSLEKYTAHDFLEFTMGRKSRQVLWKPLFVGKFGKLAKEINMAWFWARIFARSKKLGYFEGGFQGLTTHLVEKLKLMKIRFEFSTRIKALKKDKNGWQLLTEAGKKENFDRVLFTGNSKQLLNILDEKIEADYQSKLNRLESLAAMTLVLVLDQPFFDQDIYWLNINRVDWPFLAIVEHTNFITNANYGGEHIVYVGKYLDYREDLFKKNKTEILAEYSDYLQKLSPNYTKHLKKTFLFKERFAQPVVKINHSKKIPEVITPLENLYFAGMEQVYPFDRGINYAIQLGRETAKKILQ